MVNPLKALWVRLRGPRTDGPMAPELPGVYGTSERTQPIIVAGPEPSDVPKRRVA